MHIGFMGVGYMGHGAAKNILAKGYPLTVLGHRNRAPVEDLVAEGPGTLRRADTRKSSGRGQRTASGWSVVISRPLPNGLSAAVPMQVAFAVWRGDQHEVGARKMRSAWITLAMKEQP